MKQMEEYTVKVIVATHKPYKMPTDKMYLPIQVGADGKESIGYQRDDDGENISELNAYFSELTGLYWGWKNLSDDYIGLVHYRRHFAMDGKTLEYNQLNQYLGKIKLFIPKKRWYVIETLKSHYGHTHYLEHIEITRRIVLKKYPEYKRAFDKTMNRRWGYMFNMMIMAGNILNDYCTWLYDVLFEVFKNIDCSKYTAFEKRYIGRISELLFNIWIENALACGKIRKYEIMELDFDVEENMFVKVPEFLKAKFFGKKYNNSF